MHSHNHGKSCPKIWATSVIFNKMPKDNDHPRVEISPNPGRDIRWFQEPCAQCHIKRPSLRNCVGQPCNGEQKKEFQYFTLIQGANTRHDRVLRP
jgi:hypothetical protein